MVDILNVLTTIALFALKIGLGLLMLATFTFIAAKAIKLSDIVMGKVLGTSPGYPEAFLDIGENVDEEYRATLWMYGLFFQVFLAFIGANKIVCENTGWCW